MQDRRSDYDVTNTVQVSDPAAVCMAVAELFTALYPTADFHPVLRAFREFELAFRGHADGFHGIETTYHDLQHTLDVTLAMMRLVDGHERAADTRGRRLGAERAAVGVITALFHDAGYLRKTHDTRHQHGAEYTRVHVSRSARMLEELLPELGFETAAPVAAEMVHFTGYERPFDEIVIRDPLWVKTGHLLGTADMLAQMADRCYLEKCRDRLYAEFVMGGIARMRAPDGREVINYRSPRDLLQKTPDFCSITLEQRLGEKFSHAHRYMNVHFGGDNLYLDAIEKSLDHLRFVIAEDRWDLLRRKPPCFNIAYFHDSRNTRSRLLLDDAVQEHFMH
ncbi:MAG TPA: hypothetical protein VF267_00770 [Gammaproteobacteria bacterium]